MKTFAGLVGAATLEGGGSFSRRDLAEMFRAVSESVAVGCGVVEGGVEGEGEAKR